MFKDKKNKKNKYNSNDDLEPHLPIDTAILVEVDGLLKQCNAFLNENKSLFPNVQYNGPMFLKYKEWRTKGNLKKIASRYEELAPRIAEGEKSLRGKIGDVIEMKTAIKIQAKHLQNRLEGCIQFNIANVGTLDEPVESLKDMVSQFSTFSSYVKDMLNFHSEILKQKQLENISRGRHVNSWPPLIQSRQASYNNIDITPDEDHEIIMTRLDELKQTRQKFAEYLSHLLEEKETFKHNLDNCIKSLNRLKEITRNDEKIEEIKDMSYDHDRCTDCAYQSTLATHCYQNISALNDHAKETNDRLHEIVELREKMRELAEYAFAKNAAEDKNSPDKLHRIDNE